MQYPTFDVHYTGNPAQRVDIVLLPEGYTADEMEQFKADCKRFAEGLFSISPYKERQEQFNIRAVLAPSQESGVDIPGEYIWKNTILNTSFYTFDTERYIMTYDNKSLRDLAANAPYDFIYIIANTQKYGGGAIYNHYGISVSGNQHAAKVYVHEFGHLFLGLGDEYVGGSSYNDMYPKGVEPWEANLTTLVNFDKKWKDMLDNNTPIPTPYDTQNPTKLGVYEGGCLLYTSAHYSNLSIPYSNIPHSDKLLSILFLQKNILPNFLSLDILIHKNSLPDLAYPDSH